MSTGTRVPVCVLVVEDDLPAQRRLVRLVRTHPLYTDAEIHCADDLDAARQVLAAHRVQLVLLDLNLHGADGFRVLSTAIDARFRVIVVSAHTQRAIDAFETGVVDFVPKPVSEARLHVALGRVPIGSDGARPAELLVRTRAGLERVLVSDLVYIRADDDYVQLALHDGRRLLHDEPLARLVQRLPTEFVRVHRSYVVHRDAVRSAAEGEGGTRVLHLRDGTQVPVSRRRASAVLRLVLGAAKE